MLLEVLPQFCVQQPGEGPEQGLPHQPIPLPCCCSRTVQSDLLQNRTQLSMISWKSMNQTTLENNGTGCSERCGCLLPGNIQGQVGQGSEQPVLVEDVPTHYK